MSDQYTETAPSEQPIKLSRSAIAADKRVKELAYQLEKLKERVKVIEAAKTEKEALIKKLAEDSVTPRKELRAQQALIGAMIMTAWKSDPKEKEKVMARLDAFYSGDRERRVLGLRPKDTKDLQS